MSRRFLELLVVAAAVAAMVVLLGVVRPVGQSDTPEAAATPWGEPDLQCIWTRDAEEPLQRPAKYADREFFTDEERAALDKQRAELKNRVDLLDPKRGADPDMVDELVRRQLNVTRPDEVIIPLKN